MSHDIEFIGYDLKGVRKDIDNLISKVEEINSMIKSIRGVDYSLSVGFDSTEYYAWVITVYIVLYLEGGKERYIEVYSRFVGREKTPDQVFDIMCNIEKQYNVHSNDFRQDLWEWVEDTKFDGRLSYWRRN